MGSYDRIGKLSLSGSWQQIPQFYSVDTMTPYTGSGGTLVLDDATQRAIQNGQANLNAYVPLAPAFELRERRDIGRVDMVATPKPNLDVTASFTTQKHSGELPWGASFGFSNDVEVALPYDSRANDFTIGTEWTNARNMLRVAYSGSWFDNIAPTLTWDSPLRLDDNADAGPGRGRMSLWPSNSAQTISFAGYTKLARKTQLTGSFSYGLWSNDEPLQPFTINATLPQFALPRATTEGEAHVFSTNLNLTSRPSADWRFSARVRNYTYDNLMPATSITDMISYDDGPSTTPTGGPDLYAHSRTTFDGDATWTKLMPFALTFGYGHNGNGYDARIVESSGENVFRVSADAVGILVAHLPDAVPGRRSQRLRARRNAADGDWRAARDAPLRRRRSDEEPLHGAGRHRAVGGLDVQRVRPASSQDDFSNSFYGLQDSTGRTFSLAADFQRPNGLGAGGELQLRALRRAAALARGGFVNGAVQRSAARLDRRFDRDGALLLDLRRRRRASAATRRSALLVRLQPRRGAATSTRSRRAARSRRPISCPTCSTSCSSCTSTCGTGSPAASPRRSRTCTSRCSIYDFAFDPSVVNGIVQPSSLVMGYVYRPYTAHSAVFGIRYLW